MPSKNLKPGAGDDPKHNEAARKAVITKWANERLALEREEAKAIELYVKPIKEKLQRLNKNVKTDTGITLKVLGAQYTLFAMQENAKQNLDEDAAHDLIVSMKDVFTAMREGSQLDFIEAMNHASNLSADDTLKAAYGEGYVAGSGGEDRSTNTYDEDTAESDQFYLGFDKAQEEIALAMSAPDDSDDKKSAAQ